MDIKQRQTAFKARIGDVLNGKYVVNDGWEPNHILFDGRKIARANILGVVVSKQSSELSHNDSVIIDDGSGRITARSFEESDISKTRVGEVVQVIGRPREYGGEIYIVPEIIRALGNKRWIDVRRLELEMLKGEASDDTPAETVGATAGVIGAISPNRESAAIFGSADQEELKTDEDGEDKDETAESKDIGELSGPQKMLALIKKFDKEGGADTEDVIKGYGAPDCEAVIGTLLKRGEIFELRPGKLKIL